MKAKVDAIIVAAGKGVRMNTSLPKQYISLAGIPILRRTLDIFDRCDRIGRIILVVGKAELSFCRDEILKPANLRKEIRLVAGGLKRQESVDNGLQVIESDDGIIIIHDGVRPFVQPKHLVACIKGAEQHGACILAIPAVDTVKQIDSKGRIIQTHERNALWLAQTPQAFQAKLIKHALASAKQQGFTGTDEASLVERLGAAVKIIPGSRSNLKITNKEDFKIAQALLDGGFFKL